MENDATILVIDDSVIVLDIVCGFLDDQKYNVITCVSPFEGTQAAKKYPLDLILLDINMPGISGIDMVSILKKSMGDEVCPIVFYSGEPPKNLKKYVKIFGASGYIRKETTEKQFVEQVEFWLKGQKNG